MQKKKVYSKPSLEQVQLALEEAVLAGCKAAELAPGPMQGGGDCKGSGQCYFIQT